MWHHLLNGLVYILALCQLYRIWLYTGLALCIAGERIFLHRASPVYSQMRYNWHRASPVPIYLIWLYTGLALCIASFYLTLVFYLSNQNNLAWVHCRVWCCDISPGEVASLPQWVCSGCLLLTTQLSTVTKLALHFVLWYFRQRHSVVPQRFLRSV